MPPTFGTPNILCWNIAITFGMEKLEWCGYHSEIFFEDMFICFNRVHKRDGRTYRRTDRQTLHNGIGHAYAICIASCGQNHNFQEKNPSKYPI